MGWGGGYLTQRRGERREVDFEVLRFWSSRCDRVGVVESSKEVCW